MGEQADQLENSKIIIRAAYESAKRDALEEMRSYAKEHMEPLFAFAYMKGYHTGRLHGMLNAGLFFAVIVILWSVFLR